MNGVRIPNVAPPWRDPPERPLFEPSEHTPEGDAIESYCARCGEHHDDHLYSECPRTLPERTAP